MSVGPKDLVLLGIIYSKPKCSSFHCRHLKGHPLQVRHKQDWAGGLFFYYPRLLFCLNQMLAVMVLSQHRVLSSKTVRPCAPCGARCIGHTIRTWYAVCSMAPHLQFGKGVRPHLCMNKELLYTISRVIELDPRCLGQAHSNRPGTGPGYESTEPGCVFAVLHVSSIHLLKKTVSKFSKVV